MLNKMLSKELRESKSRLLSGPAPMQSGKYRLSRVRMGFLSGKKIFTITILTIALITITNAQGITNTLGGNTSADKFIIENSDSEAGLVVTGESKVGIGTTNPNLKLHVVGNTGQGTPYFTVGTILALQQNNYSNWTHLAIIAGTAGRASINFGDVNDDDAGYMRYNNSDNSMRFATNGMERIVIDNSGATGIGTTAPNAKLHIISTTTNVADNTAKFEATSIGSNASHIHYGTKGDWYIRSAASDGKVIIQDFGGNVGIGTNSPDATLHVEGTVKVGVNGLVFSEIIELTGYTSDSGSGSWSTTELSYPSGYTLINSRTLSIEINVQGEKWISNGINIHSILAAGHIKIISPNESYYRNKKFRMILMKVE